MGEFYANLAETGEMVSGFGLADPSHAVTVEIRDGRPVASDGPYAETKEVLAGFGIIDVASHDRAIEVAAQFAAIVQTRVELRPVMDGAGPEQ
jgi:hypothetical protein